MRCTIALINALILLLAGCSAAIPQQNNVVASIDMGEIEDSVVIQGYDFIKPQADTIIDATGQMNRFYEALYNLRQSGDTALAQVNIIHFGDSHIQGDGITSVVMRRIQRVFGNAGRGFITPHRLTKSNEAPDYRITSKPLPFKTARIIDLKADVGIGISGVGVKSQTAYQQYTITTLVKPEFTNEYLFNRITVFHDSLAPMITIAEDLMGDVGTNDIFYDYTTPLSINKLTDSIMLYTYAQDKFRDGALYGFLLENGKNGVLYHALGINGACFIHWGRYQEMARQTQALNPNLIIISLGSNEAAGYNFIDEVFYQQIDGCVSSIRSYNPNAVILLTTPPEAMRVRRRSIVPNPNFERIRNIMLRYGADNGVAVFDLYEATGGQNSSKHWVENKLMQRDKIHYTPEGYAVQGLLMYGALLNGYKQFCVSKNLNL